MIDDDSSFLLKPLTFKDSQEIVKKFFVNKFFGEKEIESHLKINSMKIYVKDVQYLVKHCPSEDSP
jgi:hypothetical protein